MMNSAAKNFFDEAVDPRLEANELALETIRRLLIWIGVATEPKSPARSVLLRRLPPYVGLANKLLRALRPQPDTGVLTVEQRANYRQDLRALYERLRPLFETQTAPARLFADRAGDA